MDITLDRDIAGAFQVIGLLLVFVSAYFSYTWPKTQELLRSHTPRDDDAKILRLADDLRRQRRLLVLFAVFILPILALLSPLAIRVMKDWSWGNAIRTGLSVVILFLLLAVAIIGRLVVTINRRIKELSQ
jgi:ABC-type bacteriocin/lantibiotic exporter with double-glycine peptidase domain